MTTIYVAPLASGNGSGSSAANAMGFGSLNTAIKSAGAGGTVLLLADKGTYKTTGTVTLTAGGTDSAPVTLKGVDSAGLPADIQITGTRAPYVKGMTQVGNDVFRLLSGADNLKFEGFDFHNVQTGFRIGADIRNITISNMEADNVRWFINDVVSGTNTSASVSGLTVRDVEVNGFSRSVITLRYDSNNVLIERVVGDSKYQDGDGLATGVFLDGTVHDVVIKDSTMMNAIASSATGSYWNGDGFTAEERVYNLRFENTRAIGNADGGYDIKAHNVVMTNAYAEDNGRNFRFWGQNVEVVNPIGIDPHIRGGSSSQVQVWIGDNAQVKITGGSFADSGYATRVFDSSGILSLSGTNVWHADGGTLTIGSGISGLSSALVHKVSATGRYSTTGETLLTGTTSDETAPTVTAPTTTSTSLTGTSNADVLSATTNADWTIEGSGGNDSLTGLGGNDRLVGGSGNDTIKGGAGNDTIIGNSGADVLTGGTGADIFSYLALGDSSGSTISARDKILDFEHGVDHIDLSALDANSTVSGHQAFAFIGEGVFTKTAGQLRVDYRDPKTTKIFADVNGDGAADFAIHLSGQVPITADDFLLATGETLLPATTAPISTSTSLTGTSNADVLSATSNADWTIEGSGGNDSLTGLGGNDRLVGGSGNDTIKGGAGNDTIIGNSGADVLTGGTGADIFSYLALGDSSGSTISARDKILDFEHGVDRIDLSALDANGSVSGDQAFAFIGEGVFTKTAGQLRVDYRDPAVTKVFADVNGDGAADFAIHLSGHVTVTSGDFLL